SALFPTYIIVQDALAYDNNSSFIRASYRITSASRIAFIPFKVIKSGSPGPDATNVTFGTICLFSCCMTISLIQPPDVISFALKIYAPDHNMHLQTQQ